METPILLADLVLAVRTQSVVVGPPRPGQVGDALREEEEQAVHTRAEEAYGRAVPPDLVSLLAHPSLVLDPLNRELSLHFFLCANVTSNLVFCRLVWHERACFVVGFPRNKGCEEFGAGVNSVVAWCQNGA